MFPLITALTLFYVLPILFTAELHTHPTYSEYGVRLVCQYKTKLALVVGLGKLIVRIEL